MVRFAVVALLIACKGVNPAFCPDDDPTCLGGGAACANGIDDDLDGLRDLEDPGCFGAEDDDEHGQLACDDGVDGDADGLIDLADPGCSGPGDSDEHSVDLVCDDGLDNDTDGRADFRANGTGDACCLSPTTVDEGCPCITQIAAGATHSCSLKIDAASALVSMCWGDNSKGEIGDATMTDRLVPTPVMTTAIDLVGGGQHSCGRLADGTVQCWGLGKSGQLGNGADLDSPIPVPVMALANVVQLTDGETHACARLDDGTARCWGGNKFGQLGDATKLNRNVPVEVADLAQVVDLDAGSTHTCAALNDGTVWCWGENDRGQLGSVGADSLVPIQVPGLTTARAVSLGIKFSCALLIDNTVACWGLNMAGQLGDGTMAMSRATPEVIAGLVDVVQLSAGGAHACALHDDGTLSCWGENGNGELGDGTNVDKRAPIAVPTITEAIQVAAGSAHTCVTRDDTTNIVRCWGLNSDGQLGNNSMTESRTPITTLLTCP